MSSTIFLLKFETVEKERARLYEELLEHQTVAMREREAKHNRHMQELDKATLQFSHEMDKMMAETDARVKSKSASYELITTQLRLQLEQAHKDNRALQVLNNERENRINALVMKQCQKLNRKIDETLDARWKKWLAHAVDVV